MVFLLEIRETVKMIITQTVNDWSQTYNYKHEQVSNLVFFLHPVDHCGYIRAKVRGHNYMQQQQQTQWNNWKSCLLQKYSENVA